jgi:hypothetical protein
LQAPSVRRRRRLQRCVFWARIVWATRRAACRAPREPTATRRASRVQHARAFAVWVIIVPREARVRRRPSVQRARTVMSLVCQRPHARACARPATFASPARHSRRPQLAPPARTSGRRAARVRRRVCRRPRAFGARRAPRRICRALQAPSVRRPRRLQHCVRWARIVWATRRAACRAPWEPTATRRAARARRARAFAARAIIVPRRAQMQRRPPVPRARTAARLA